MRMHIFFKHSFLALFFALVFSMFLFPNLAVAKNVPCIRNYEKDAPLQCIILSEGACSEQCSVAKKAGLSCHQEDILPSCEQWDLDYEQKKQRAAAAQKELQQNRARTMADIRANAKVCKCKRGDSATLDIVEVPVDRCILAALSDGPDQETRTQAEVDAINAANAEFLRNDNLFSCVVEARGTTDSNNTSNDAAAAAANTALRQKNEAALKDNPFKDYADDLLELNKIKGATDIQGLIGVAIKTAMGIMGTIALAMTIYGGVLWMTAMGNSSQIDKAINVIFWAALGIFVIFGSYAIVTFIFDATNPILQK
jgi:hypothetical protein